MGLLDALFSNDSGGGLLGGLPQSWQWQNPADANSNKDFLAALRQDPSSGNNLVAPQSPFGPVPNFQQAPQSVFAGGAAPVQGGFDPSLLTPQQPTQQPAPMAPQSPVQQAPAPQMAAPAPQNNPINTMPVGNYQMPQFGNAADYTPQNAPARATDMSAQSRQPQPEQPLPPAFGGSGYLQRLNAGGGLIGSLLGDTPQQQNLKAQYDATRQALIANGVPERQAASTAMLAVMNPEAAKTVLPELLTNKEKYGVVGENPVEGKKYGFINERDQTINGKPIGAGGAGGGVGGPGLLAPGVKEYNPSLSGNEYMAQFSPEVQAAAKSYINGDVMPTGNPRAQGITTLAKTVAQKFGMDTGTPVNDQTYAAKRKMVTDMAASGNSTMGGILSNGKSSFKHLAEYTDSAADLGNASHNFPGGGIAAHAQNYIGNTLGGSDTQGKIKAISDNLGHYGQESTKFYAASGGGVEERTNALKQMNPSTNSGEETAAYAEKEKNLMLDRFHEKEAQIRDVMGEKYLQEHPVFTPELQRDIARIDANVARLRGGGQATGNTTKSGVTWSIVK